MSFHEIYLQQLQSALASISEQQMTEFVKLVVAAHSRGNTVFVAGNGGSAATASHAVCDFGKGASVEGCERIRVVGLADNTSLISAVGNDMGYDRVFAEQVEIMGRPGDVLVLLSASGNSPNVLCAAATAHARQMTVVGLTGFDGGRLAKVADLSIAIPHGNYGVVEDVHLVAMHMASQWVRRQLLAARPGGAKKAAFLDRDGIINRAPPQHRHVRSWKEFEFIPGCIDALRCVQQAGYVLIVATNQRGVATGELSEEDLRDIHARMCRRLEAEGVHIEDVLYCPHEAGACGCRKPQPGMLLQAERRHDIDLGASIMIGDSESDVLAGRSAGCRCILVSAEAAETAADVVAPSLEAVPRALQLLGAAPPEPPQPTAEHVEANLSRSVA